MSTNLKQREHPDEMMIVTSKNHGLPKRIIFVADPVLWGPNEDFAFYGFPMSKPGIVYGIIGIIKSADRIHTWPYPVPLVCSHRILADECGGAGDDRIPRSTERDVEHPLAQGKYQSFPSKWMCCFMIVRDAVDIRGQWHVGLHFHPVFPDSTGNASASFCFKTDGLRVIDKIWSDLSRNTCKHPIFQRIWTQIHDWFRVSLSFPPLEMSTPWLHPVIIMGGHKFVYGTILNGLRMGCDDSQADDKPSQQ